MNKQTEMLLLGSREKISMILQQLVEMVKELKQQEEPSHIDLLQLPLSTDELLKLWEILGEGEIHAEVEHLGISRIYSTSVPAVWRVTHFDDNDEVLSDFLEVSYCPEIMITHDEDINSGIELMKAKIFEIGMSDKRR